MPTSAAVFALLFIFKASSPWFESTQRCLQWLAKSSVILDSKKMTRSEYTHAHTRKVPKIHGSVTLRWVRDVDLLGTGPTLEGRGHLLYGAQRSDFARTLKCRAFRSALHYKWSWQPLRNCQADLIHHEIDLDWDEETWRHNMLKVELITRRCKAYENDTLLVIRKRYLHGLQFHPHTKSRG